MTVPVQASIISPQAVIADVLSRYDLGSRPGCELHKYGVNDTYQVTGAAGHYFLRVHTLRYSDPAAIGREVELLTALDRKRIPVGAPIADQCGRYVQSIEAPEGRRYAVLFRGLRGRCVRLEDSSQVEAFGTWTAAFHNAADDLKLPGARAPLDTERMVYRNLALFLPRLAHRPEDAAFATELADSLAGRLDALDCDPTDVGVVHGDLHSGNTVYRRDSGVQVFDFADSGTGWRLYDLGVFLFSLRANVQEKTQQAQTWNRFLRGYLTHHTIRRELLDEILLFVLLKQFWLLGFHTTMTERHGSAWMHDRYYDTAFRRMRQSAAELQLV